MNPPTLRPAAVRADLERELNEELLALRAQHRLRRLRLPHGVDFSSNDYLGYAHHPSVVRAARDAAAEWGAGSGASRLLSGHLGVHEALEAALARFKREEAALVFTSGYLANLGAVTALLDNRDVVLVDRLNHASLVDAARLSGAKFWVYPHGDLDRLAELLGRAKGFRRRLVMTDAYFSMDGHTAPLDRLLELCEGTDSILMVDEAHSTGVFGKTGRGLTEHFGLCGRVPVVMGTLSKALGASGGFVAGSRALIDTLVNRAKSFIYTTAPVPAASAAALASIQLLNRPTGATGRSPLRKLWANIHQMREGLSELELDLMHSEGPIIPVRIGDAARALAIRDALDRAGFSVAAIRPPTVPRGTERIRISVSAARTAEEVRGLLQALKKVLKK